MHLEIKEKMFAKHGVSDWQLEFDNGKVIDIDAVTREDICYMADGKIDINLVDALIRPDFIHYIRKGNIVKLVTQKTKLRGSETGKDYNFEELYDDLKIITTYIHGEVGEYQTVNINLISQ